MTKKILLLGSGELGKEFVIAAQRLGQTVVACDSYAGAPAMQVADACEVFPPARYLQMNDTPCEEPLRSGTSLRDTRRRSALAPGIKLIFLEN